MKKVFLALTLVLVSGYAVNAVYAAAPTAKYELTKDGDGDKDKKKKKGTTETKTETKSCSGSSGASTSGKSCCAGKK